MKIAKPNSDDIFNLIFTWVPYIVLFYIFYYLLVHGHLVAAILQGICWVIFCYKEKFFYDTRKELQSLRDKLNKSVYIYYRDFYDITYDKFCNDEPYSNCYIEDASALIYDGIQLRMSVKNSVDSAYSVPQNTSYDISGFKKFLSLQTKMLNNPEAYKDKTICVEGYILSSMSLYNSDEPVRDSLVVWLSPIPCKTELERIQYYLACHLQLTASIDLCSDEALPTEEGLHIRVYGIPYYYTAWDGSDGGTVRILVRNYEVI